MAGRPKGGQKRAHKGPIYGPATLDARNIRSTLSMGMWPQGGGEYFSSTPPAVDAPRHPEPQCPPVAACARSPFQYIRAESSRGFEMSQFLELVLFRLFKLYPFFKKKLSVNSTISDSAGRPEALLQPHLAQRAPPTPRPARCGVRSTGGSQLAN